MKKHCTCKNPQIESNMCVPYCRVCSKFIIDPTFETMKKELKYCSHCMQMTNHLEDVCQKCKPNSDWREEFEEKYQCNECNLIFTGIGTDTCLECEGILHKIEEVNTPLNSDWREGFDKKFCKLRHDGYMELVNLHAPDIKSFIASTIQSEIDKERERIIDFIESQKRYEKRNKI